MADLTTVDPLFLALFANDVGSDELSGGGYARLSITNDVTVFSVDGGTGARTSIVPLSTVSASSAWAMVRSIGFYDSSGGGTLLAWVAIPPVLVGIGQSLTFLAGDLGYTSGGSGAITPAYAGASNIARSLYLYANRGLEALSVPARSLYLYVNRGIEALAVLSRSLYLYENRQIEALAVLARALYAYEELHDGEVFPWLMKIDPTEQYRGGQVDLYGDGFGEVLEAAAGATITTSSVSGGNVGGNTVDRAAAEWISTSGTGAWVRYTFGAAKTITAIAIEDIAGAEAWGVPEFRFSDGGANVTGGSAVPKATAMTTSAEYPVGGVRGLYALPAPRTTTYVEIRVASGGSGTNRGLREVWILEDLDQAAETSTVALGVDGMGIVGWANRSPGLHPANGGQPITPAATVTVPPTGESGMVVVTEST